MANVFTTMGRGSALGDTEGPTYTISPHNEKVPIVDGVICIKNPVNVVNVEIH